jgi:hypothetical protein
MKTYKENQIVIYIDNEGNRYDTFAIFDTDPETGLTHINHLNLRVDSASLELHPRSAGGNPAPMADPLSFDLFNQLKEKYTRLDKMKHTAAPVALYTDPEFLAKAS